LIALTNAPPHTPGAPPDKPAAIEPTPAQKKRAVWMVVAFTLVAAAAQPLFKQGAARIGDNLTLAGLIATLITDYPLIIGLVMYGFGASLMILALRHGELSVLFPIISLSYVWVAILSVLIFHESMNVIKVAGIATIILGVAILGRGGSK
jgi:drug/metabolite transporter (DMT)-like permease